MKTWLLAVALAVPCVAHARPTLLGETFLKASEDVDGSVTDDGDDGGPRLGTALGLPPPPEFPVPAGLLCIMVGALLGGSLPAIALGVILDVIGVGTLIGTIVVVQQRKAWNAEHHIAAIEPSPTYPVFAYR